MKLLATIRQAPQAETPVWGREPNTVAPADDTSGQAFDGILAKVKTTETQGPSKLPSSAPPTKPTAPTRNAAATADQGNPGAILDLLVDGAEPSGRAATILASTPIDDGDGTVGKLLKHLKSKDGDEAADKKACANMPGTDQPFLPALFANAQVEAKGGNGHRDPTTTDGLQSAGLPTPVVPGEAERDRSAAVPPSDSAIALGVSVSTHVAPAKHDGAHAVASDDEDPTPAPDINGHSPAMVASDDAGSSPHDKRPSGDGRSDAALQTPVETPVATAATPIASHAPIRGIATAVVELASQASAPPAVPETSKAVGAAPARTVILQMSPADLGTVEIRLHMSGQALDLQLTISEQRTLGLVTRERASLAKALEDHNYELNSLVIQDGSAALPGGTHVGKHETSGDRHAERQGGGSDGPGAQAGGDGRRGQDGRQDTARPSRSALHPRSDAAPRSRGPDGRSLFI